MERVVGRIAGLGVSGLILMAAINASGYVGAASITFALSSLGPGGMIGGVLTLGVIAMIVDAIAEYGYETIHKRVTKELYKRGETLESIKQKVEKYPVSKQLKRKIIEV